MFSLTLLTYPTIDPVLIQLGPLAIRWYALAYLAGIMGGYYYISALNARLSPKFLTKKHLDDMIVWAVLGIILGGRLGYVLFYKPDYYAANLSEIPMIWQGGMAFHGGMLGVIVAFYLFTRRYHLSYLRLMDPIACAAPIGLLFGRLANFINGELYGRISDCAICMIFPHAGPDPRHPSQLYQAALEGLALFIVLMLLRRYSPLGQKPGALAGVFLLGYAAARSIAEFFREPDAHLGFLSFGLTMGQWLSLPMALLGLYLLLKPTKIAS
jgi:phosphatidylglycerol:prolipoprotein diacylglycerol transferase